MKNKSLYFDSRLTIPVFSLCMLLVTYVQGNSLHKNNPRLATKTLPVPSLENIEVPPTYYQPNPQDPEGDWIVWEDYYTPTADRIWAPYQSKDIPGMTFAPTNDWFQTLAICPQGGVMSTTGYYHMSWNGTAKNGLTFRCPKAFKYYPTPNVPASGHFTVDLDATSGTFSMIAPESGTNPKAYWISSDTGNMLRSINYLDGQLILYLVQGSVFQGALYNNCQVNISIPSGSEASSSSVGGLEKYQVNDTNGFSYLVYAATSVNLVWQNQALLSSQPYSGYLNIVCLPTEQLSQEVSSLLDTYARAVIVQASGALNSTADSNYDYTFSYTAIDLLTPKESSTPLILLMDHQLNKARLVSTQQPTSLSLLSLKGLLPAYVGSQFQFKFPDVYQSLSTDPLPAPGISQSQAIALIENQLLDNGLDAAIDAPAPTLSIPYNKFLYQKALTLFYAQKVILISGKPNTWSVKLSQLRQSLIEGLDNLWKGTSTFPEKIQGEIVEQPSGIRKDLNWGTIVFFPDSYGSAVYLNDHIVQYGYPLYALTLLDQYEDIAGISEKYLNQISVIPPYKNSDLGNFLALDIGQSGESSFISHRNLDFYEGHSWLSGLGISNDGQNTESESEALLGSMSIVAWLQQTSKDPALIQIAKNRWFLETSAYQSYWQVDPTTSPYQQVCPEYVSSHLLSSMVWQNKITAETWWGLEWDRILACIFMPAAANLLDNYLGVTVSPTYAKQIANYVQENWQTFDTANPIQSILIPLVARSAAGSTTPPLGLPTVVQSMINDVKNGKIQFDQGTNELILTVIAMYAQNRYK